MTNPGNDNPRVMFISASVGGGHNEAAKAVMEALPSVLPGAQVELVDVMQLVPKWVRAYYAGGFKIMMAHLGWLYGIGFGWQNHPQRPGRSLAEKLRLWHERRALAPLRKLLQEKQPHLVVHTHFMAPPAVAAWIDRGLNVRQVTIATDVDMHRWWYSEHVERWFVPSELGTEAMSRWGIPRDDVTVSGIPIRPKWLTPHDRQNIYREWLLPQDKKIVLLCGGAEFTAGPVVQAARGIYDACPQSCVVVLAGRSKELLAELTKLNLPQDRFRPMGFTDRMPELAEVASIMVTKAGGITTSECLSKALPMVFLKPVPGQEGGNAQYFQRQGAGVITRSVPEIVAAVRSLLEDPSRLEEMSQKAGKLYRPATDIICRSIVELVRGS